ncbi:MAG: S26 family signal peptidase [Wenzhouxiangellaceae bacterium]
MTAQALVVAQLNSVPIRRCRRWMGLTLGIIFSVWLVCLLLSPWYRLGINGTDSLPGVLYLVFKQATPDTRGDLVAFYPPQNRFYPQGMVFIKQAMGMPGDEVTRQGQDFYINGEYIATAKTHSRSRQPLRPGPTGVIPDGRYFVWTPHPDSYDSRYEDIGWIFNDRVIGRAVRLF